MTETHTQSNKNNSNNNLHHCHWLPCSIDYDGLAPIHIHFRPETITTLNDNDDSNNNNNKDDNNKMMIQAVSFRGRGLLSKTHSNTTTNNSNNKNDQQPAKTLPLGIIGSVLSIDEHQHQHHHHQQQEQQSNNHDHFLPILTTKEKFDTILEWEHESNENNLIQVEDLKKVEEEEGKEISNDDIMKLMYDTQTQGSIGKSLAIFNILDVVHTPIPVEEEE